MTLAQLLAFNVALLVAIVALLFGRAIRRGFNEMAEALKTRAEG